DVDREDREAARVQRATQALDARHLLAAGFAPGRPEVHQHHPAAKVLEALRLAVERRELERRRRAAGPGLERLRLRGQRAEGEQEEELHRPGNVSKKSPAIAGLRLQRPRYFVSAFFSALALDFFSALALPLPFFSVFFSADVGALGAASDFGVC